MPEDGAETYLRRLLVDRLIPSHPVIVTVVTLGILAGVLWLSPWPLDALLAGSAAVGWTSWLDEREPS